MGRSSEALPLLGALALAAQRLLPLLQQLYRGWAALTSRSEVLGDVYRLLTLPLPPSEPGRAVPFEREIRLEGVSFRYEVRERPVLGAVDLTLRKGERVALTGRTGSGKSTLADLVMGLLPPTEGVIRVDGRVLAAADLPGWRRNVAHVPQAIFLIDDSLLANIAFGVPEGEIDPGRARAAAQVAQLGDLMAELPDGLSTTVGERGVRLSGGQRQRLGLARAIYRGAPLLVLDEATNALDPATEAAVVRSLDELQASGVTILIIAHRAAALEGCHRVFHLADGRVRSAEPVPA